MLDQAFNEVYTKFKLHFYRAVDRRPSTASVALKQAPLLIRPALMKKALFLFFSLLMAVTGVFVAFAPPAAAEAVDL